MTKRFKVNFKFIYLLAFPVAVFNGHTYLIVICKIFAENVLRYNMFLDVSKADVDAEIANAESTKRPKCS